VGQGDDDGDFRRSALACLDGLYSFARSLAKSRPAAEDLVQETYVRALRAAHRPSDPAGMRPWLFTILHNIWRNERRRRPIVSFDGHPDLLRALPAVPAAAEDALDHDARAERIRQSIEALPDAYREVVLLRFGQGLSYREIAEVMECPAGTVMSRLARARALIAEAVRPKRERRRASLRAIR
jgi:RNA polymerase sigma-70 factor (ECF subfamily)